jgi:hypothetical protein
LFCDCRHIFKNTRGEQCNCPRCDPLWKSPGEKLDDSLHKLFGVRKMATAAALAFVQKLYVAYYQRPADYAGQQFWAEKFDKEGGASAIASAFATSAESVTLYGSQALAAQINAVYQASFGRAAETAGLQFYLNEISAGRMTTGTMAVAVLNGASGSDLTTLNSKLAVAAAYTTAASDAAGILKYAGTTAADTARTFLAAVTTANQATQTAAVTTNLNSIVVAGNSFTLTTGIDNSTGTASNDSFSSTLAGAFGLLDNLDGGAGTDILTVSDTTAIATATSQVIKNIETVTLSSSAGVTADMSTWTGLTKANLSGVGVMSATAADSTVVAVTTSGANAVTVIGSGGDLAVTTGAGAVNIGQTSVANKLASVTVNGGSTVNITDRSGTAAVTGSTLKTVTVNGATAATAITGDGVTTLNLTNLTGVGALSNVTLTAAAATRALVVNLSGVDEGGTGAASAGGVSAVTDATATSLSINAMTTKSFDVTAVAGAATSVAVKADVDLHMDALTAGVATTVSLLGAGKISIDTATLAASAVITSTNTGGVTVGATAALAAGQQFVGTSSSGADSISIATTSTVAHTTGAGNDTVTLAGALGTGGTVNGGDGTDVLSLIAATAAAETVTTVANAAKYTNFETLRITDAVIAATGIDVTKLGTALTTVNFHGGFTTATNTTTLNTGSVVGIGADSTNATGFTVGGSGTTDALTINTNGWDETGVLTVTGVETLTINTGVVAGAAVASTATVIGVEGDVSTFAGITMVPTAPATGATTAAILFTGANSFTAGAAIQAVNVINASGLTGSAALVMSGTTTSNGNGITITGSANVDTLIGSAQNDVITAGAGVDTITGAAGADTLTGGAGADVFTYGASATDIVVYAGADTSAANIEKITDFVAGSDTIRFVLTSVVAGLTPVALTGVSVNENNGTLISAAPIAIAAGAASITALTALFETAASGVASALGVAAAATGLQVYTFTTAAGAGAFDGKSYLVINDATAALAATDVIVEITGVTGNIAATSFVFS